MTDIHFGVVLAPNQTKYLQVVNELRCRELQPEAELKQQQDVPLVVSLALLSP